jgi:hypothetical protein
MATYSEMMRSIISKLGIDPDTLSDNLYSTLLSTIDESVGTGGEGVTIRNQSKTFTENGTYTADSGYTGLGTVTVNVETDTGDLTTAEETALRDKADAVTGESSATLAGAVDALIAGFGSGGSSGGDGMAEFLFETEFTVAESLVGANNQQVAVIETGLTQADWTEGSCFYVTVVCTEDTDTDFNYPHFRKRTQLVCGGGSGYIEVQKNSGVANYITTSGNSGWEYGSSFGLFVSAAGRYCASLTLSAKDHTTTWGTVVSGTYKLRMYRLPNENFGL